MAGDKLTDPGGLIVRLREFELWKLVVDVFPETDSPYAVGEPTEMLAGTVKVMRATVELSIITEEAVVVTALPPEGVNVMPTLAAEMVPDGKGLALKLT